MKINLTVQGMEERIEVDALPFSIDPKDGGVCITTPMHDDWLQSVNYDLRKARAIVQGGHSWEICFPDVEARILFQLWLVDANAKAKHGYKTMWP